MSINSINTFAQTVFLTIPLKTVQSISWIALSILTLPSFVVGSTHSYFFARKAVEIWSKNKTEATIKVSKANPNTNLSTNSTLEQWVKDAPREENRVAVQERIQKFFSEEEKDYLTLSNSKLTSLPNIFNDSRFSRLRFLNLTCNQLTTLPESFGNLQALIRLELARNQLTALPESFGNLQALIRLDLDRNQLTTLPESFGNLQALTTLLLSNNNRLEALPESFGNLQALIRLYLSSNRLTTLPESFGNLQALIRLHLSDNQLTTLPESFGNLQALIRLHLSNNQLTALPESFGNLPALTRLDLDSNQLTTLAESLSSLQTLHTLCLANNQNLHGIPMQMLNLRSDCSIDLEGCNLSVAIRERLRESMRDPDYMGPRISYSITDIRLEIEEKAIQESLESLYAIIGKMPREFAQLEKTPELRSWLNRLSDTADYKTGGELKKAFAKKIIEYLNQANESTEFRSTFNEIIKDASSICGDRVTLSVLHLSIAYQLATIDLKDMKKLVDFLIKGSWTIEMLEQIARNKIPTLPFFDEIEVYLGYPIKLKQELQIPIDSQEMLYFACSALKPEDLEEAKNCVLIKQNNQEARLEFLISQGKWKEALLANYPQEYEAIVDKRAKASEQEDADYSILAEEHKKDLIELTKKALESATFSEQKNLS